MVSASLQVGAQTNCDLPINFFEISLFRSLCLPHKKQLIVADPMKADALNGEPATFDW